MNISREVRWQLWIVAMAFFMEMLDATIVNTALPSMARSLGVNPLQMHSVVVAYVLTVAIMLPASGWIADRFGLRRTLLWAVTLFATGSLCCALSADLEQLVLSRVLQGVGGAMMLPVGRLAVLKLVPRSELMAAMNLVTVPGLVGPLVGPPLGGLLVEYASWHWIFLINLPVALVGFIAIWYLMSDACLPVKRFDWRGFVLLALTMATLTLALERSGHGAGLVPIWSLWLVASLAALGYLWHARHHPQPLFSLKLFSCPSFRIGVAGNLLARVGSGALPFITPLFMQVGLGVSPLVAGFSLIPVVIGSMGMKVVVVTLVQRLGYRSVLVGTTLALAINMLLFAWAGLNGWYWLLPFQLLLLGMINSVRFSTMNNLTLKDLPDTLASAGNSLLSMVMQLSMSLGVSLVGFLLARSGHPVEAASSAVDVSSAFMQTYLWLSLVLALPALVFARVPGRA